MKGIGKHVVDMALENGATMAGIASMQALQSSASHRNYTKIGAYTGVDTFDVEGGSRRPPLYHWPASAQSVLVIGLSHPKNQPKLDWWDGNGTPGNQRLIQIVRSTRQLIETRLRTKTHTLHYYVEYGGLFLKDAAVLAGLGVIGLNNMVVTPSYGPRVRFRALLIDAAIEPTGSDPFTPCSDCSRPCRKACPEKAMAQRVPIFDTLREPVALPAGDGTYDRARCMIRMEKDEDASRNSNNVISRPVKYCRRCELACPVGMPNAAPKTTKSV